LELPNPEFGWKARTWLTPMFSEPSSGH
jgi:hypothetical protein